MELGCHLYSHIIAEIQRADEHFAKRALQLCISRIRAI